MLKELGLEPHIIIDTKDGSELVYMLENKSECDTDAFLSYILESKCCIKRIAWVSKFDREEVSYVKPKIFDAYNCVVHSIGRKENLENAINLYANREKKVKFLNNCLLNC